jgi:glutamate synthase (NADPH/NADH) small chain
VANPPSWLIAHGVKLDDAGRVVVDARGRTTQAKIYAGGDNTRGPDLVVTAMAAGRLAAEGMLEAFSLGGKVREKVRYLLPAHLVKPALSFSLSRGRERAGVRGDAWRKGPNSADALSPAPLPLAGEGLSSAQR